uniref:Uncharacterized protein n=1 Tax=Elizabethkingia anophelis TaxID=1117645 RepID=A0A455ZCS8_9FLAO|nr:TPA_exp: hypothetical protein [Elizabethkingia anophelis]
MAVKGSIWLSVALKAKGHQLIDALSGYYLLILENNHIMSCYQFLGHLAIL